MLSEWLFRAWEVMPPPDRLGLTLLVVFGAALLRGFTGFGFAIAAVPLLSLFGTPAHAVALALAMQFLGGLLDLRKAAPSCHWPSLRWLAAGAVLGSPLGTLVLSLVAASSARVVIGLLTLTAAAVVGFGFRLSGIPGRLATAGMGFVAGLTNGVAAMPGPPAVAYYLTLPLDRIAVRASLLVFFLATSITALASSALLGLLDLETVVLSLVSLPVMWAGTWLGTQAFTRGSERMHRAVSVGVLVAIALTSILRGLAE